MENDVMKDDKELLFNFCFIETINEFKLTMIFYQKRIPQMQRDLNVDRNFKKISVVS
jgi:hypothetical protein